MLREGFPRVAVVTALPVYLCQLSLAPSLLSQSILLLTVLQESFAEEAITSATASATVSKAESGRQLDMGFDAYPKFAPEVKAS